MFPFSNFPRLMALQESTVVLNPEQYAGLKEQINGVGLFLGGLVAVIALFVGAAVLAILLSGR